MANPDPLRLALLASLAWAMAWPVAAQESVQDLLARSEALVRVDPDASRGLAERALAAPAGAASPDQQAVAHLLLCEHHGERDGALAEAHARQARAVIAQAKRAGLLARLLACEADIHEAAGRVSEALSLYEQAVLSAQEAQDDEYLAESMYRRGHLRGVRGEFAIGLWDLKRAHDLYDKLGKAGHTTIVQNAIAILYNRMGDHVQARHYYEAALKTQTAAGLTREQLVTQHNLGRVLENLGEWGAAEHAFGQSLKLSEDLNYERGMAYALRGLASVHNAGGRADMALQALARAAALQQKLPDMRLRGLIQLQRGIALSQLRRAGESQAALLDAVEVFRKTESNVERARTHAELTRLLAGQNDWRGAYDHQTELLALTETLLKRRVDERFTTLKIEYDNAAREREVKLLKREQAATSFALEQERLAGRLRSATIALASVLLTLLGVLAWRQRRGRLAMHLLAMTDELTRLPNRRDVLARLDSQLRRDTPCTLLIIDLDHFKRVNDNHGHQAGDEVLRRAADVLRDSMPAQAHLGRLGGEEFIAVLPGLPIGDAVQVAQRLRLRIEAMDLSGAMPEGRITASIGIAAAVAGDDASQLLRRADRALYAAKAGGRNRVEVEVPVVSAAAIAPDRNPA